jgi:aspartate kinase
MKFGGTSVQDADAMEQVVSIVKSKLSRRPIVVVSAMAQVTDTLVRCAHLASRGREFEADELIEDTLRKRHHEVIAQLLQDSLRRKLVETTIDKYLDEVKALIHGLALLGELTPRSLDAVTSYGERLSSTILSEAMRERGVNAELIDTRQIIITDEDYTKATPLMELSEARSKEILHPLLQKGAVPIAQGFIASTRDGITTTLGRGGSDYSAAIIGALLEAEVIEIWTDVDGILTADPRIVPEARVLENVTFQEASELAYFGAKVLHPSTILPAVKKNIPVHVYNTKRPESHGTHIVSAGETSEGWNGVVKCIASKNGITIINVYSTRMLLAHGFLRSIFEVFDKFETSVDIVSTSEVNVSLTIDNTSNLQSILNQLKEFSSVTFEQGKAIVCVVGEKMRDTPGIAGRVFSSIQDVNVKMISEGASEINLSFVVNETDAPRVVRQLHREFFR